MHNAADLKARVDLRDIVRRLWGEPEHSSPRYDVHRARWRKDGSRASFTVYADRYKDYGGSGEGGDVFAFIQKDLNLTFKEALAWVADYLGGTAPDHQPRRAPTAPPRHPSQEPPPIQWQQAAQGALAGAQAYLWGDTPDAAQVRDYLRTVRGFTDDTIKRAGYGYNPTWRRVDGAGMLAPGIIEPWACDGALWALRVRCRVGNLAAALGIPDDTIRGNTSPKYLNLKGSKQAGALYNADAITWQRTVLIVEGGFDARLAEQCLNANTPPAGTRLSSPLQDIAVVTFGSAHNTPSPRRIAQLRGARRVFLLLDDDAAGQSARAALQSALDGKAQVITLPQGKDVTEFVVTHGGDLAALLHDAMSPPQPARKMPPAAANDGRRTPALSLRSDDDDCARDGVAWWDGGVPDGVRSVLLTYFRPVTAPVIELLHTAIQNDLVSAAGFTADDVLTANDTLNFGISAGSVRRVLAELSGYFFAEVDTVDLAGESVSNPAKKRGRRAIRYRLLPWLTVRDNMAAWALPRIIEKAYPNPPDDEAAIATPTPEMFTALGFTLENAEQVAAQLKEAYPLAFGDTRPWSRMAGEIGKVRYKLYRMQSTPLPEGWSLANGTLYRAALLRATNDEEERRSRRSICELLGVSNGSVGKMIELAGLQKREKDGEFEEFVLESPDHVQREVNDKARRLAGYPRSVLIDRDGVITRLPYHAEDTAERIVDALEEGAEVAVQVQVANHFIAVTDEQPVSVAPAAASTATDDAPRKRAPKRPTAPRSRPAPRKKIFGPVHDPVWVLGQLAQILMEYGRLRYLPERDEYVDVDSGRVVALDAETLLHHLGVGGRPPD